MECGFNRNLIIFAFQIISRNNGQRSDHYLIIYLRMIRLSGQGLAWMELFRKFQL